MGWHPVADDGCHNERGLAMLHRFFVSVAHKRSFTRGHSLIHTLYFGAVFMEGHGIYATAGGIMAVFTIVSALAGENE